jgi:hypothetical protein
VATPTAKRFGVFALKRGSPRMARAVLWPPLMNTTPSFRSISRSVWISLFVLGAGLAAVGCGDSEGDDGGDDDDDGSGNSGNSGTGNSGNSGTGNSGTGNEGNSGTGNEGNTSQQCDTQYFCVNGACECSAGPQNGNGCCDPDDPACEGDPGNCNDLCYYCQ